MPVRYIKTYVTSTTCLRKRSLLLKGYDKGREVPAMLGTDTNCDGKARTVNCFAFLKTDKITEIVVRK